MTKQDTGPQEGQTEGDRTLWELVPVADYRLPEMPAAHAAQARWVSLKRLFAGPRHDNEAPARTEAALSRLPAQRLDALVASVNWGPGAKVLQRELAEGGSDDAVRFLIGPPRSGHVELLRRWATEQGAHWIEPPKYDDILEVGPAWLAGWPSDAHCWVLTRLEHCWLRHPAGLALVRELLDRALSGRLGHGVIGCDSWAWAYLRYVAPLPTPSALTLQAFDGKRLAALFRHLVAVEAPAQFHFCDAQTGKRVLTVDGEDNDDGSAELQSLAAHCRGNAGLARELWRARLRDEPKSEPGTDKDTADQDARPAADGHDDDKAVWVSAPAEEPALAADGEEEPALVLHALLLHNGLPGGRLAEVLPLPPFRVQGTLHRLAGAGLVAAAPTGHWHITAAGYPWARGLLQAQDLLLDDF